MTNPDPFPFPSLDFPERKALTPDEVAQRLGCTGRHIRELVDEGRIEAIDISGRNNISDRKTCRIPVEAYRQFILGSLTSGLAQSAVRHLTDDELVTLYREIRDLLTQRQQRKQNRS